jgi:hypothetical protein
MTWPITSQSRFWAANQRPDHARFQHRSARPARRKSNTDYPLAGSEPLTKSNPSRKQEQLRLASDSRPKPPRPSEDRSSGFDAVGATIKGRKVWMMLGAIIHKYLYRGPPGEFPVWGRATSHGKTTIWLGIIKTFDGAMEVLVLGEPSERNKTRAGLKRETNFGTNFWNPGKTVSYGQLEKGRRRMFTPTRLDLSGGRRCWPRNGHSGPSVNVNCMIFSP